MHIKPQLTIVHPYVTAAQERLYRLETARWKSPPETIREAREAVAYAKLTALVDLLTGEFTKEELSELVTRLDAALYEFG